MQMFIDHASVVYGAYGPAALIVAGVFVFALMVWLFRRIGAAAYTFPALILIVIFALIFVPREVFDAIAAGQGSEEARANLARLEALAPARYLAAPALAISALIFLRGNFLVPVLVLAVGIVYVIEVQSNPERLASLGLPVVDVPDISLDNIPGLQLGGGASGLSEGVSGLSESIPLGN